MAVDKLNMMFNFNTKLRSRSVKVTVVAPEMIVLNSFDGEVLKEGIDLKALVQKLRKEIYQKILATISDIEGAKKGRYARNADER